MVRTVRCGRPTFAEAVANGEIAPIPDLPMLPCSPPNEEVRPVAGLQIERDPTTRIAIALYTSS
jgi:hypothetical protein